MLGQSLIDRIGHTPLLALGKADSGAALFAKAEWNNPGGSVKDRAAWSMLDAAERSGAMNASRTVLEATSGNTGIALAMLCAARGYKVRLCLPENISPERRRILAAYGAEITFTDPAESSDGAIRKAREIVAAEPDKYCYTDQYSNPENWQAHYRTTAEEIWQQTEGRVTHFTATMGTSGTFIGTARRLKELNPAIRCVSLQPDAAFHGLEGLKHMASAMVPAIYDPSVADEDVGISTEAAYAAVRYLARKQGLLVGISAGAAWAGTNVVARRAPAGAVVVTVFADNADKYLSERFWQEGK
ncbi:MAG TPA: PLP-dependent cysteine synthase family protein [Terriglobales bacterium]|nr:PLP-dependent cysteine synthase family protein [Terriglobales bacterium]